MNSTSNRRVWDIHGGIHPQQNKLQSSQQHISGAGIPDILVFPLSQHIGTPAKAIVKVGDKVLKGQMIAEAKGIISVPIHASSSGEVIAIESRSIPHPSGITAQCIVVKTDGKDQWTTLSSIDHYTDMDRTQLLDRIHDAGIAGMGGAGFPTAVKLASGEDQHIDTLIINGTECEPYITADDRLMRERAHEIIEGSKILSYLISPAKETIIGVEDNKPEAIASLREAAKGTDIEVVSFPTKYPSGGEKQLIQILTGKEVPSGGLPAHIGVVCQNIGSTVAIYQAIQYGKPLISRITTITGNAFGQQKNLEVLLGTPVNFLLQQCDFNSQQCARIIIGGPMMGFTLEDDSAPVVKTTNCILAPSAKELGLPEPAQACIRCGMCEQACPVSLLPQQMYWFSRGKEYDKLESHNIADCIECGACAYVCPSNIPLVQYYRASKAGIRQHKQDALNAEHSKARFEARKERIERQEAEKIAKREARKAAAEARAAGGDGKADAVQAAIERAKAKKSSPDPALLAIEKAKSKRANIIDEKPDEESLTKALTNIGARLDKAREKLHQAEQEGSDKAEALGLGVQKTEEKYHQAQKELDDFRATLKDSSAESNKPGSSEKSTEPDVAGNAIARALAKRESAATMSDQEKLENTVNSLEKRIEKSTQKLTKAESEGNETAAILAESIAKLNTKLDDAKKALEEIT